MKKKREEFSKKLKAFLKSQTPRKFRTLSKLFLAVGISKPMYDNWIRKREPNIPGVLAWKKICVLNPSQKLRKLWAEIRGYDLNEGIFESKKTKPQIQTQLSPHVYLTFVNAVKMLNDEDVEAAYLKVKERLKKR